MNRLQLAWAFNSPFNMPKVKSSAKAHTSTIPDQEMLFLVPMRKAQAPTMSQKMKSHSIQADHKLPIQ